LAVVASSLSSNLAAAEDDDDDDDDDDDETWDEMYKHLHKFYKKYGHCRVGINGLNDEMIKIKNNNGPQSSSSSGESKSESKSKSLQYWVTYQHRRMRPEIKNRGGARSLSLKEEKLLNELNFCPLYKEIVQEFNKYLGRRIAKKFEFLQDDGIEKKQIYFGTIGRISSISNKVSLYL
jgi:hypothetical protein